MYIYVCIFMYIYVYININIHTHTPTHTPTHVHMYVQVWPSRSNQTVIFALGSLCNYGIGFCGLGVSFVGNTILLVCVWAATWVVCYMPTNLLLPDAHLVESSIKSLSLKHTHIHTHIHIHTHKHTHIHTHIHTHTHTHTRALVGSMLHAHEPHTY